MKIINEGFTGIINQSKMLHLKHNCDESENLVYMATELQARFEKFVKEEKKKIDACVNLLECLY